MDWFESVRAAARTLRGQLTAHGKVLTSRELIESAVQHLDLELYYISAGAPQLKGARASFDMQSRTICCASEGSLADRAALVAHELGHACLDTVSMSCAEHEVDISQPSELAPVGLQRVEDYGQRERRELRANVFAREFLLPHAEARRLYLVESLGTDAIAVRLDLPATLVRQQLLDALLLPPANDSIDVELAPRIPDPSQARASAYRDSPFLLQAGPGTGKTHALVERVSGLLDEHVDPASIAILTFSNRAAGELYERLSRAHTTASASIWIGTFHAFGLDLLRRYYDRLGLSANPTLFDRSDGIAMLEEELPTLELKHYRDLWNPARELRHMLVAISRAKDELVDEVAYRGLAQRMIDSARTDEERTTAEKAMEVARVYERYQAGLREHDAVDFGDLIMRPTLLLERDSAVRAAVALRHRHILVDEYQDVNRASARLLSAIVGSGKRLWVVGDSRQSIYRFRGASSVNMKRFELDYAGAKTDQLGLNYRSSSELVDALVTIAPNMAASQQLLPLQFSANRGASGVVPEIRRVETPSEELDALVATIRELAQHGVPLRDQAVLCRSNPKVAEIAAALEARDIPVLHLGSIFERDEIRDLLAVLTLVVDRRGDGLVRLGTMARYGLSLEDVQAALAWLRDDAVAAAGPRLHAVAEAAALSPSGRDGLRRLADDLAGFTAGSAPWEVLTTFALDRTRLVGDLAVKTSVVGRMRAVAIWQFLNFARQPVPGSGPGIRRFLTRVRMMVLLAEERDLRRVPVAALHLDAVRLMTVHAAKGLEFEAVHIPGMTKQSFPASRQGDPCPPPPDLIEGGVDLVGAHEEEEQCLFFVAVSRARTHLYLYAAAKHESGRKRTPSPYLDWLRGIASDRQMPRSYAATDESVSAVTIAWSGGCRVTHHALKSYDRCPRRFLYTHLLDVGTARSPTAYSRTQDCLFNLIEWVAKERATRVVTESDLLEKFAEIWRAQGPTNHAFAADYLRIAERLVRNLAHSGAGLVFQEPRVFEIDFDAGTLIVKPDELATSSSGALVLRRVRPGYRRRDERDLDYDLLDLAGARAHDGAHAIEAVHLTDDTREVIEVTPKQRATNAARTAGVLAEIHAGRFPAEVSSYNCPQCPHFFICPSIPAGTLVPADRKT